MSIKFPWISNGQPGVGDIPFECLCIMRQLEFLGYAFSSRLGHEIREIPLWVNVTRICAQAEGKCDNWERLQSAQSQLKQVPVISVGYSPSRILFSSNRSLSSIFLFKFSLQLLFSSSSREEWDTLLKQ